MTKTILKNITIEKRQAVNGQPFFLIRDLVSQQAYFCFQNNLKNCWNDLVTNWTNIEEIVIEYLAEERGNKVVSLAIQQLANEIFL